MRKPETLPEKIKHFAFNTGHWLKRRGWILLLCFFFSSNPLHAQITSNSNGDWNSTGTWTGNSVPTATDSVIIDSEVTIQTGTTAEAKGLHIDKSGILIVKGTLIVYGNLTMANNDPELIAGSDATIIIHGDAIISNKVNINLSSYFIVLGNFTIIGGGGTDININDASIYVFGTFDGGSTDLTICEDYDNNTDDYTNEKCHVGTDSAFYDNDDAGLIPDEITDLVDPCTPPSITLNPSSTDKDYCVEESADSLTVSASGDGLTYQWYSNTFAINSGGTELTGETDTIYTPSTSTEGTFYFYCVVNGDCGADTSNVSGAITVHELPTATISGEATICEGESATITVDLTGTPDWNLTFQLDGTNYLTVENIPSSPYTFNVSQPGTYTVSAVSDANCAGTASGSSTVTVDQFNMVVSDVTPEPSGNHCPEFLPPFDANTESYNPGVTEVVFKVEKNLSPSTSWTFDFMVDETGNVEVYDLAIAGNTSAISYGSDDAGGSINATDNTEVTFTFQIWNVPGTTLDVDFVVSNGNDGNCDETGTLTDNSEIHTINVMPVVGTFNP